MVSVPEEQDLRGRHPAAVRVVSVPEEQDLRGQYPEAVRVVSVPEEPGLREQYPEAARAVSVPWEQDLRGHGLWKAVSALWEPDLRRQVREAANALGEHGLQGELSAPEMQNRAGSPETLWRMTMMSSSLNF